LELDDLVLLLELGDSGLLYRRLGDGFRVLQVSGSEEFLWGIEDFLRLLEMSWAEEFYSFHLERHRELVVS
jgi:hypothetical protein